MSLKPGPVMADLHGLSLTAEDRELLLHLDERVEHLTGPREERELTIGLNEERGRSYSSAALPTPLLGWGEEGSDRGALICVELVNASDLILVPRMRDGYVSRDVALRSVVLKEACEEAI